MSLAPVLQGPPRLDSPTTLKEALDFYAKQGLAVTPVAQGTKQGRKKGWAKPGHRAGAADFKLTDNIAVLNGTESNVAPRVHRIQQRGGRTYRPRRHVRRGL